jgi:hypothetical protein
MGPIGCPKTSVGNYRCTLCDIPKERRSQRVMYLSKMVEYSCYIQCATSFMSSCRHKTIARFTVKQGNLTHSHTKRKIEQSEGALKNCSEQEIELMTAVDRYIKRNVT